MMIKIALINCLFVNSNKEHLNKIVKSIHTALTSILLSIFSFNLCFFRLAKKLIKVKTKH